MRDTIIALLLLLFATTARADLCSMVYEAFADDYPSERPKIQAYIAECRTQYNPDKMGPKETRTRITVEDAFRIYGQPNSHIHSTIWIPSNTPPNETSDDIRYDGLILGFRNGHLLTFSK